jgi:hypothetical protein
MTHSFLILLAFFSFLNIFCDYGFASLVDKNLEIPEIQEEVKELRRKLNINIQENIPKEDSSEVVAQYKKIPRGSKLAEGQNIPFYAPIAEEYVRNIFTRVMLEDGNYVVINIDNNNYPHASIVRDNQRNLLLENGHYELLDGKLFRLPPQHYQLTNDRSMLISIYNGSVINYLPRIAVLSGDFQLFTLDK